MDGQDMDTAVFLAEAKKSFQTDIFHIPRAISEAIEAYQTQNRELVEKCKQLCQGKKRMIFAAEGTSLCASHVGMHLLAERGYWAHAIEASEFFVTYGKLDLSDSVVVFVSYSGGTRETLQAGRAVAGKAPMIAVTNHTGSELSKLCDISLPMVAGSERLMALKSFTMTIVLLNIVVDAFCGKVMTDNLVREWRECAGAIQDMLSHRINEFHAMFSRMSGADYVTVLSDGLLGGTAMDGALILKEGAGIHSEFMSAFNFRHGPLMTADNKSLIILLAVRHQEFYQQLIKEIRGYGARVLVISSMDFAGDDQVGILGMPAVAYATLPAMYILPLQLYAEFNCTEQAMTALHHINEVVVSKKPVNLSATSIS